MSSDDGIQIFIAGMNEKLDDIDIIDKDNTTLVGNAKGELETIIENCAYYIELCNTGYTDEARCGKKSELIDIKKRANEKLKELQTGGRRRKRTKRRSSRRKSRKVSRRKRKISRKRRK